MVISTGRVWPASICESSALVVYSRMQANSASAYRSVDVHDVGQRRLVNAHSHSSLDGAIDGHSSSLGNHRGGGVPFCLFTLG